ncbi:uncharacterized [Tachysurus ichikawai]
MDIKRSDYHLKSFQMETYFCFQKPKGQKMMSVESEIVIQITRMVKNRPTAHSVVCRKSTLLLPCTGPRTSVITLRKASKLVQQPKLV